MKCGEVCLPFHPSHSHDALSRSTGGMQMLNCKELESANLHRWRHVPNAWQALFAIGSFGALAASLKLPTAEPKMNWENSDAG